MMRLLSHLSRTSIAVLTMLALVTPSVFAESDKAPANPPGKNVNEKLNPPDKKMDKNRPDKHSQPDKDTSKDKHTDKKIDKDAHKGTDREKKG